MAVSNTIRPMAQGDPMTITYKSGDDEVRLSPDIVKKYLVSGNPDRITAQEIVLFINLCKFQHLNPFLKEAYCIKYGNSPATMVVSEAVLEKRARRSPDFRGFEAGVYVLDQNGKLAERDGEFYLPNEKIVGGWCRVYVNGYEKPMFAAVTMAEYIGRKGDGTPNAQWSGKPATMIRKVAKAHALREAFPEDTKGLYIAEEMGVNEPADIMSNTVPAQAAESGQVQQIESNPEVIDIETQDDFASIMEG